MTGVMWNRVVMRNPCDVECQGVARKQQATSRWHAVCMLVCLCVCLSMHVRSLRAHTHTHAQWVILCLFVRALVRERERERERRERDLLGGSRRVLWCGEP
jgi:hypothetical protein